MHIFQNITGAATAFVTRVKFADVPAAAPHALPSSRMPRNRMPTRVYCHWCQQQIDRRRHELTFRLHFAHGLLINPHQQPSRPDTNTQRCKCDVARSSVLSTSSLGVSNLPTERVTAAPTARKTYASYECVPRAPATPRACTQLMMTSAFRVLLIQYRPVAEAGLSTK